MTNFEKVIEFNKCFGLPHYDTEQTNIFTENPKLLNLRISLCDEEIKELEEAVNTNDFIEVIDALTDELYVIYGAASSLGINIDKMIKAHTLNNENVSNFSKICIYNLSMMEQTGIEYQQLNYRNYKKGNIMKQIIEDDKTHVVKSQIISLKKLISTLQSCVSSQNFIDIKNTLLMLLIKTYRLGQFLSIDLDESFSIVHNSNMSKLCSTEEQAQETVELYKKNDKRYDTPSYRLSYNQKYWVIYNESTGKILKNKDYIPANFESLL